MNQKLNFSSFWTRNYSKWGGKKKKKKKDGRYLLKTTDNMKGLKCFNQTEKKALAT